MSKTSPAHLEALFGLIVHDLRNPAATLGANIGFLREVVADPSVPQEDLQDALADAHQALTDLMRGLDQLAWMGSWFNDRSALSQHPKELRVIIDGLRRRIQHGPVEFLLPERNMLVRGGEALERLLEVLVCNGHQHARGKPVCVAVRDEGREVVFEVFDQGRPLAPEFRTSAFTLAGQFDLKGRADGRYGRVLGLFAAGILAEAIGARLDASERAGGNVFFVTLPAE